MDSVHDFLARNRELIYFAYGLIFFTLGLAIALQTRRSSRLDLARSLRWLASFAFLHAFNEWGDLFIPIQAEHLSRPIVELLYGIQLLLLASSFACLFQFGVALLSPQGRGKWLRAVPAAVMGVWLFFTFFILLPTAWDLVSWHHTGDALARYFIAFPGAAVAAYALRDNTFRRIAPLNVPAIVRNLRVAGIALFFYALLAGFIPPPVSFFPGSVVNAASFDTLVGVPPLIFRSLAAFVLAVTVIRALEIFQVEADRRIEQLEQSHIIAAERGRIARELHDGAIQKVYTAGLLVQSAARLAEPRSDLANRLERALSALNDSIVDLRGNLTELHTVTEPREKTLDAALERLASDPHYNSLVAVSLETHLPATHSLSSTQLEHVVAIVGEALANVARHAQARHVSLDARNMDGRLQVTVHDDGIGYAPGAGAGYGIRNMRDRARLLNGQLEVDGVENRGTTVTLTIPWQDE
jgi:signal transduction histidine kinase